MSQQRNDDGRDAPIDYQRLQHHLSDYLKSGDVLAKLDEVVANAEERGDLVRCTLLAASRAVAGRIAEGRVADALRVALAAMCVARGSPVLIEHDHGPGGKAGALVLRLARLDFAAALAVCADEPDAAIEDAFCEAVALAVDLRKAPDESARGLIRFVESLGAPLDEPIAAQFDYPGYFAVAGRPASLGAIRDCAGPAAESDRAWMKDEQLAQEAATLARAKGWTPEFLRSGR